MVVSCGALNSALLLLGRRTTPTRKGLANGSDQVGRNYIRHNNVAVMRSSRTPNPTRLQKTLVLNDWYLKGEDWDYPWGSIQMLGKSDGEQLRRWRPTSWPGGPSSHPGRARGHRRSRRRLLDVIGGPATADSRITLDKDGTVRLSLPQDNNIEGSSGCARSSTPCWPTSASTRSPTSAACTSTRA